MPYVAMSPPKPPLFSRPSQAIVNATLGSNDNDRFLEHFRYQIIASQLLSEDAGSVTSPTPPYNQNPIRAPLPELTATTSGACVAAAIAFALVWTWRWARGSNNAYTLDVRVLVATVTTTAVFAAIWIYVTRRSILYLRRNVIDVASTFTTNLHSLNSSSLSVISLIQEVELVSRGYRL